MKRVYPKGSEIAIAGDYQPVVIPDGRVVLLSGLEWVQNGTDEQRMALAEALAYEDFMTTGYMHGRILRRE